MKRTWMLATLLALAADAFVQQIAYGDEATQLSPEMPELLPEDAFLTGTVATEADVDGVRISLLPGDSGVELHLENPSSDAVVFEETIELTHARGMLVSRMGPLPMPIGTEDLRVELAPGASRNVPLTGAIDATPLQPMEFPTTSAVVRAGDEVEARVSMDWGTHAW